MEQIVYASKIPIICFPLIDIAFDHCKLHIDNNEVSFGNTAENIRKFVTKKDKLGEI